MRAFALTIFTGAFLLFQVQPLIGKFLLPWFGGSPAVWTTCMLFFQVLLLGGYAYAHLSTRLFPPRAQAVVHIALLVAALAMLPITPEASGKPLSAGDPTWRILALLTVCLGLPYFVLSSTGPLMQEWFRRTNPGVSPYRLYALSNVGSLLALLSYPFLFEPLLSRQAQASLWSWGLGFFALGCGWCAVQLWRLNPASSPPGESCAEPDLHPALPTTKILWFGLSACASVLLLATTNKMCQDVSVIPFLWVLPLSLYLATFIICFDNPPWYRRKLFNLALIPTMGAIGYALFKGEDFPILVQVVIYTSALFICCMVCHGELYKLKPHPRYLTSFYLMIAAGGAAGGLFVALVAPLIFNSYLELHWGFALLSGLLVVIYAREKTMLTLADTAVPGWKFALIGALVLAMLLSVHVWHAEKDTVAIARNFYGVLRVTEYDRDVPEEHVFYLQFGEITHGLQFAAPQKAAWPTTYYHAKTGVGLVLQNLSRPGARHIGAVGLGVGTLAVYGEQGDSIRFYEINPDVRRLAETRFTYLTNAKARVEIVMGDARLSLENEAPQQFDVLAVDAFSNDAIPVHLLTREAFEIYLRHLKPDGVIALHITNRHLDLLPVVQNLAAHFKLHTSLIISKDPDRPWWLMPSNWVLVTPSREFLERAAIREATTVRPTDQQRVPLWTDDYASLFNILK